MARRNISIVHSFSELEKHRCGYCKQINTNCSYDMWAESLTVEDYQNLIDRGWRRSGKYCYKPVMNMTCCPLYTIRCEALNFKLSKSQKKIIKRVNRYLSDSSEEKSNIESHSSEDMVMDSIQHEKVVKNFDIDQIQTDQISLLINKNALMTEDDNLDTIKSAMEQSEMSTSSSSIINKEYKTGKGADPSRPPCKKAKLIRLERKQTKLAAKGNTTTKSSNSIPAQGKTFEEFIENVSESPAHKLKVCLVLTGGNNANWTQIRSQEYPIYRKYQMKVHGDPSEKCSERQFTNFLLESPLQHTDNQSGPQKGYGSFHQQYWLDDKLIAVGVIDILPKCISSVYFFYDPDYRHLTLGTYGSLRELYFVRQIQTTVPSLKYYYMGFYIHSCPKMKYKAKLFPSFLLCPETYFWFAMERCVPKLDKDKYSRLNVDQSATDRNACTSSDIDELLILIGYKNCIPFKFIKDKLRDHEDYKLFGNLIGKKCVSRILFVSKDADF